MTYCTLKITLQSYCSCWKYIKRVIIFLQSGCTKVYTSTSDVMTHENFHKKNQEFVSNGFQRYRATEPCGMAQCPFANQRTTHFHCTWVSWRVRYCKVERTLLEPAAKNKWNSKRICFVSASTKYAYRGRCSRFSIKERHRKKSPLKETRFFDFW